MYVASEMYSSSRLITQTRQWVCQLTDKFHLYNLTFAAFRSSPAFACHSLRTLAPLRHLSTG